MSTYRIKALVPAAFLVITLLMLWAIPREGQFKYQYQKGTPWMYESLDATFDFPILKTEEEIRTERERLTRNFIPYFAMKPDIEATQLRYFSSEVVINGLSDGLQSNVLSTLQNVYKRGVINELRYQELNADIGLVVVRGSEAQKVSLGDVYTPATALKFVEQQLSQLPADSLKRIRSAFPDLSIFITPNLVYDDNTTFSIQSANLQDISLTKGIVHAGQRIVNQDQVVTSDIEQVLNSLRAEYHSTIGYSGKRGLLILGQFLILLLWMGLLCIVLHTLRPVTLTSFGELSFCLSLAVIAVVGASLVFRLQPNALLLLPFPVLVLYLDSFYPTRFSLPVYIVLMLPLAIVTDSYQIAFCNILAGSVAAFSFRYWGRSWQQFLSALMVFITYLVADLSFHLISEGSFGTFDAFVFGRYAINSVLMVACYPVVFIFEKMYGFVSLSRLRDLADTGNKALRELSEKAPGTMQHAMQVANLAENAARVIGAYALLCRVGALYHDIGKIKNPQYFVENQSAGFNPHTLLQPQESAAIVIRHVEDGKNLARKYALPTLVSNFIESHHGQTKTEYFYNAYCNAGGNPQDTEDFTYHGKLPTTKEEVIVMLADAVEAACRSLSDYSVENITAMVHKVVRLRIAEDQLRNADITYRDIQRVQDIFITRVHDMYHTRIAYPSAPSPSEREEGKE